MTSKTRMALLKIGVAFSAAVVLAACNPVVNDSRSSTRIYIDSITGTDAEGNEATFLESDVVVVGQSGQPTVTANSAVATLRAETLDPLPLLGSSHYQDILITRYVVTYTRTDGQNGNGVGVPHQFEGSLSVRVPVGQSASFAFVVVRAVSKLEPPLIDLAANRSDGVLQTTARIDFYGQDGVGNKVTATGHLTIFFANFADQSGGGGGGAEGF